MNKNLIKVLGIAATAVGIAATLLADWVNEKNMEEKIEEKVNEAFAEREEDEEEES